MFQKLFRPFIVQITQILCKLSYFSLNFSPNTSELFFWNKIVVFLQLQISTYIFFEIIGSVLLLHFLKVFILGKCENNTYSSLIQISLHNCTSSKVFLTVNRPGQNNFRNKIHRKFKFFYKYVQKMWKQYCFKPHGLFDKLNLNLVTYRCTSSKVCNLSPKTSSISGQSIHAFSFAFPRGSCSYLKL